MKGVRSIVNPTAVTNRFITRQVGKTKKYVTKKVANDDISDPLIVAKHSESIIKMAGRYPIDKIGQVRWSLLKDDSFPDDIRKLREMTGWTDEQIIAHYWNVDKFRELWEKILSMTKDDLEFCIVTMSRDKDWEAKDYENKVKVLA